MLWADASAQTVYRCGPEGRTYSQTPCSTGKAIDVSDMRSDAQRREAAQVMRRQDTLGRAMEDERLDREARPEGAATLGSAPQANTSSSAKHKAKGAKQKKSRKQANEADARTVVVVPTKPRKPAKPKN